MTISTHVLDAARGCPAASVAVQLSGSDGNVLAQAHTDADGRIAQLAEALDAGDYQLRFDTGAYFATTGQDSFYPEVRVTFRVDDAQQHYHVPLLLAPFAYSTYRGS